MKRRPVHWKAFGAPYISERAWGYGPRGLIRPTARGVGITFPHDHAPLNRALSMERGTAIAGLCDRHPADLFLRFALWNGRDPILKERLLLG